MTRWFAPMAIVLFLFGTLLAPLVTPNARAHDAPASEHTGTIRMDGVVSDGRTGAALGGAYVYASIASPGGSDWTYDKDTTDAAGHFVLYLTNGTGSINVGHDGYEPVTLPVSVAGPAKLAIDLKAFPPRDAILEGTVFDAATGKPVPDATVSVNDGIYYLGAEGAGTSGAATGSADAPKETATPPSEPSGVSSMPIRCCPGGDNGYNTTTTDADGHYRMGTTAGTKQVNAYKDGYVGFYSHLTVAANTTTPFDVKMRPYPKEDAVLSGRVIDRETGKPIAGAGVSANNLEWGRGNYATTDKNGGFTLNLMPGFTEVWVYAYAQPTPVPLDTKPGEPGAATAAPTRSYYEWVTDLALVSGANALTAKLAPKPDATVVLLGYVVDAVNKTGIPDVWVNVRNDDTGEWGGAQTDATGSFKIPVRPGYLVLSAYAAHHFGANVIVEAKTAGVQRVDLALTPGDPQYYYGCGYGAPCVYEMKGARASSAAPPPAAPNTATAGSNAPPNTFAPSGPTGATDRTTGQSSGAATYRGSGGGLGPYTPAPTQSTPGSPGTQVPSPGALLVLGTLAVIALAARRRR